MRSVALAWRIAWRSVVGNRGRTAAMVVALAVPLAAAVLVATAQASSPPTRQQLVGEQIGAAEAVAVSSDPSTGGSLVSSLEAGPPHVVRGAVTPEVSGTVRVRTDGLELSPALYGLDLRDPLTAGRMHLVSGRPPSAEDEVALSVAVTKRLDVGLGAVLTVGSDDGARTMRVVSAVRSRQDTARRFAVVTPEAATQLLDAERQAADGQSVTGGGQAQVSWLLSARPNDPAALEGAGWAVQSRVDVRRMLERQASDVRDEVGPLVYAAGGFALLEVGLVLWTVFVLTVQRRRRDLAVLAAAGAQPKTRRRIVTAEGLLVGAAAVAIAVCVGLMAGALAAPMVAEARNQVTGPFRIPYVPMAIVVVAGIGVPAVAARFASRAIGSDVVSALADRPTTPATTSTGGRWAWVALVGAGAAAMFLGVAGQTMLLVAVGCAAWIGAAGLWLSRTLPAFGGVVRRGLAATLGTRLVGRAAGRSSALATVIASLLVMAGIALVGAGGMTAQAEASYQPSFPTGSAFAVMSRPPHPATLARMAENLDGRAVIPLGVPTTPQPPPSETGGHVLTFWGQYTAQVPPSACNTQAEDRARGRFLPAGCGQGGPPGGRVAVVAADRLPAVLGRQPTTAERDHARDGSAILLDSRLSNEGSVTLTAPDPVDDDTTIRHTLPAVAAWDEFPYQDLPAVLITPPGLDAIGGEIQPATSYLYVPAGDKPITAEQEDRSRATLSADVSAGSIDYRVERGPQAAATLRRLIIAVTMLLIVVVTTLTHVAVALATTQMRPDLSAIAAAGAPPAVRSSLTAHHASLIAVIAVATGTAITLLATPAVLGILNAPLTVGPWVTMTAIGAVAVGTAATAGRLSGRRVATLVRRVR